MPNTSPNQKIIHIHRESLAGSFLGINNETWKNAARVLGAQAFLLYIYLASNKDDFNLALSPKAIQQEIGMPPSTFRDQLPKLEAQGFLMPGKGNVYHFYETPITQSTRGALNSTEEKSTAAVHESTAAVYERTPEDIQIYINNKERIINKPGEEDKYGRINNDYLINKQGFKF